jgi:hypothetical protein
MGFDKITKKVRRVGEKKWVKTEPWGLQHKVIMEKQKNQTKKAERE